MCRDVTLVLFCLSVGLEKPNSLLLKLCSLWSPKVFLSFLILPQAKGQIFFSLTNLLWVFHPNKMRKTASKFWPFKSELTERSFFEYLRLIIFDWLHARHQLGKGLNLLHKFIRVFKLKTWKLKNYLNTWPRDSRVPQVPLGSLWGQSSFNRLNTFWNLSSLNA